MGNIDTKETKDAIEGEFVEDKTVTEKALATWSPSFVRPLEEMVAQRDRNVEYMRRVLKEGVHYGKIPGTGDKPTLLKPGAQALCRDLALHPDQVIMEHIADVLGKDHEGEPFLSYNIKCELFVIKQDGTRVWVGSGVGACNSWEERYRWRTSVRICPACGKDAIIKGNPKYAPRDERGAVIDGYAKGGFLCWKKKDGCDAKFSDDDPKITGQALGKVANEKVMDLDNTIFKQAAKRALVEAVLNVTGASDVFTQDVEESHAPDERHSDERPAAEQPKAAPAPARPDAPPKEAPKPWSQFYRDGFTSLFKTILGFKKDKDPKATQAIDAIAAFRTKNRLDTWEKVWLRGDLMAEMFAILGVAELPKEPDPDLKFDPDAVPS